jgi:glyceraldehyde 3-phosphate dehydrogenase
MRVAINGFGRIGRSVFRILDKRADAEVVAINDVFDHDALRYLLNYDTVMGRFEGTSRLEGDDLVTAHGRTRMIRERDPLKLPWRDMNVDVVVESTGIFTTREQLSKHLEAGAKRVVLTVPAKDAIDYTVVLGVNDQGLKAEHRTISNASCTTNCLAPLAKVLSDSFGIVEGIINTVHAYTNDQRLADVPHSDWRRSRAAAENIIPTSTGAAKAVGPVLAQL